MEQSSITAAGVIDTFLVLLIGIGPKIALVPFLQITAPLDPATTQRVARKMLVTAATVAFALIVLGEPLRSLLHFEVGVAVDRRWRDPARAGRPDGDRTRPIRQPAHRGQGPDAARPGAAGRAVPAQPGRDRRPGDDLAEAKSLPVLAAEIAILAVVLLLDLVVFRWASRVGQTLNEDRMLVIEKVSGFLLAAVAVQLVLDGLASVGVIPHLKH